jgi:hypothetical protein
MMETVLLPHHSFWSVMHTTAKSSTAWRGANGKRKTSAAEAGDLRPPETCCLVSPPGGGSRKHRITGGYGTENQLPLRSKLFFKGKVKITGRRPRFGLAVRQPGKIHRYLPFQSIALFREDIAGGRKLSVARHRHRSENADKEVDPACWKLCLRMFSSENYR